MARKVYTLITGVVICLLSVFSGCRVVYPAVHNLPKEVDAAKFPKRIIQKSDSAFYFFKSSIIDPKVAAIRVDEKSFDATGVSLSTLSSLHRTLSFLIIRNDSILYERYSPEIKDTSTVSSFSVAKTFVSTLIGIAIDDGRIKGTNQSITDFIPELKSKGFEPIKISHLLKHTSGILFSKQAFNPISDNAQFYYGKDLRIRTLDMEIAEAPDLHFDYQSENYQLLGLVIERVTEKTLSTYLQEKLWTPLGMEHDAFWSLDNDSEQGIEKAFCCLNAITRDYAKLGRLYLNRGNWNGKQLLSERWVQEATQPDSIGGGKFNFKYNWTTGPEKYGSYFAVGLYGQFIYVYPEKKVIIVRFGKENLKYNPAYWKTVFLQIVDQL